MLVSIFHAIQLLIEKKRIKLYLSICFLLALLKKLDKIVKNKKIFRIITQFKKSHMIFVDRETHVSYATLSSIKNK
jgi:hypothetical protein